MLSRSLPSYIDIAQSFYGQACDLCQEGPSVNLLRLINLWGGALAECLLDYDAPDAAAERCLEEIEITLNSDDWVAPALRSAAAAEQDTELGRTLARLYLGDGLEWSLNARNALVEVGRGIRAMAGADDACDALMADALRTGVRYELSAHGICDRAIDVKIAAQRWTIADCILGLSALAGSHQARLLFDAGISNQASIERALDDLMRVMMEEAIRHGVPEEVGLLHGIPANDVPVAMNAELIRSIEPLALTVLEEMHIIDRTIQAIALAKAAGRMLAVAAAGEAPDIEHIVARPLALRAMMGAFRAAV
ncbi:MAG: hypothetical protein H6865_07560 [Rhodospirillales bacterium]|nr:hypothetical protein [Alphaproteobacteria bacterium]MCB9987471.1 hypothetical protein [Rhodospirillales bacterium]USO07552.1 MAG: hypothetical protein H6866_09095 [Rhodospirillales bacterium]